MINQKQNTESLLEFPCVFPIKAIGVNMQGLEKTVLMLLKPYVPEVSTADIRINPSKKGRYVSVTAIITATSRKQLDDIYCALSAHHDILMTL